MSKEKLRKVLGLIESIVSVARCTFTPFHLGMHSYTCKIAPNFGI
jgi:hypothetical protein